MNIREGDIIKLDGRMAWVVDHYYDWSSITFADGETSIWWNLNFNENADRVEVVGHFESDGAGCFGKDGSPRCDHE